MMKSWGTTGAFMRETIRRIGPDEFHAVWETRTGDAWTVYSVERLRRRRP